jgi:catechol 2,3-dioxygenase-like lactoylglutathione lyase family enzyme
MRPQPLIACRDVEASSRFYQRLLGCKSAHGGPEYERLVDPQRQQTEHGSEGLILQLHSWEAEHDHGAIGDPHAKPYGNGVLLWFEVDDFDAVVGRANELGAEVVLPVHRNPPEGPGGPAHRELWIRDLDGYVVVIASPDGEAAE